MTARGGLTYGANYEHANDKRALAVDFHQGLTIAVDSEANIAAYPTLPGVVRAIMPNGKWGIEVSSWGGWRYPSIYWRLRSDFGVEARKRGWHMKHKSGAIIEVEIPDPSKPRDQWQALQLVDLTIEAALKWYIARLKAFVDQYRPDFLFYDEWHTTLGFLPNANDIILANAERDGGRDKAWRRAMTRLIRGVAFPAMPNGTGRTSDVPMFNQYCYSQNSAGAGYLGACAKAADHAIWYDTGMVFEHPADDASTAADLSRLCATYGGCAQLNPGGRFDRPIPVFPEDAS